METTCICIPDLYRMLSVVPHSKQSTVVQEDGAVVQHNKTRALRLSQKKVESVTNWKRETNAGWSERREGASQTRLYTLKFKKQCWHTCIRSVWDASFYVCVSSSLSPGREAVPIGQHFWVFHISQSMHCHCSWRMTVTAYGGTFCWEISPKKIFTIGHVKIMKLGRN